MPTPNCTGGTIPSLQVINGDCSCVSIQSITWNNAGNQFTITLTNGQSITSPVLEGAEGATPVIAFRVSGSILQYNVDGGAWINLFDLASLTGSSMLWNDISDNATSTNAIQILKSFTMAAGQLASDGDMVQIRARFKANSDNVSKQCYVFLDGSQICEYSMYALVTSCELNVTISRTGATAGKADIEIYASIGGGLSYLTKYRFLLPISAVSVSAWADALDIEIKADDNAGNAITCELFQVTYFKI